MMRCIRVGDGAPRTLKIERFVSARSSHGHLFKHLVPLDGEDVERWSDLIPDPPLIPDLSERRRRATGHCQNVRGCGLPAHRDHERCAECDNRDALAEVSSRLRPLLDAYLAEGARAFAWSGLRMYAFRSESDRAGHVRLRTVDNRRVLAVATRDEGGPDLLLTCYRRNDLPVAGLFLKLARERVGHRNAGTLVPLAVIDGEGEP